MPSGKDTQFPADANTAGARAADALESNQIVVAQDAESKQKAPRWLRAVGLQLPEANTIKRLNKSVVTDVGIVKNHCYLEEVPGAKKAKE